MQQARWLGQGVFLCILTSLAAQFSQPTQAGEPVSAFVEGLCQRRLFDQAVDYLEGLRSSPLAADELKQSIDFEQGAVLIRAAAAAQDYAVKERSLDDARQRLEKFITAYPQHRLVPAANLQLANILVDRGRIKVGQSQKGTDAEKSRLIGEARQLFAEAQQKFIAAEQDFASQLDKIPRLIPPDQPELKDRRQQLAGDLAQARWMNAGVDYEMSKTAEPGSEEAKKHLKQAVAKYSAMHETYRTLGAGLRAHLWEGRCYQDLGEIKKALGCFQDLMDLPPETDFHRSLRTSGVRYAMECWIHPSEKKFTEAAVRGEEWLKSYSRVHDSEDDALAIRYLVGAAYHGQYESLPAKDPNRRRLAASARQHLEPVARRTGEHQGPARTLLAKLGGTTRAENGGPGDVEPKDFIEAYNLAQQAFEARQAAEIGLKISQENNVTDKLDEFRLEREAKTGEAIKYYRIALRLLPKAKDVQIETINDIRYRLAFLCYQVGQYFDSAVLGEYLAQQFPDTTQGREGARIAMWSYVQIYNESKHADKDFEIDQILRVAEYITRRWPNEAMAADASGQLLLFSLQQRQLDKAIEYLNKIPEDSPGRAQAELRAGQAFWDAYRKNAAVEQAERMPQEELNRFKQQAQQSLERGLERLKKSGSVNALVVGAALSLAQVYVETGQHAKAIEQLEDAQIGPLTLLQKKDPLTNREGFPVATYSLALLAYVGVEPQQLQKAEEIMNALEELVGGSNDAKAGEMLTAIYISLGRQLQQQLQELRQSGQTKELENVSKGFEIFLARIAQREKGNTFSSLTWVAETFFSLGSGLGDESQPLVPQARSYFEQAAQTYQRILDTAEKDPGFAPEPESLIGLRLRLAICQRRLGNFDEAIRQIVLVLSEKPTNLTAQVQGAETYQAQGAVDSSGYVKAIRGGEPAKDGQNIIWGWGKLAKVTMNHAQFEDTFHLARRNLAESRYLYGRKLKNKDKRKSTIEAARQDLWLTYKLHPTLGGPESYAEYDRLLKKIQQSLKAKVIGLQEFKNREAANAKASAAK